MGTGSSYSPETKTMVDNFILSGPVVIFSKSFCPYCQQAKTILNKYYKDYRVMEMDNELNSKICNEAQSYLGKLTGGRTVPRVFIGGKSIGGCDDTTRLDNKGKLKGLIEDAIKTI